MSIFDRCYETFFKRMEHVISKEMIDESKVEALIARLEEKEDYMLLAILGKFMDGKKLKARRIELMLTEFSFLYDFTNSLRNVYSRMRTDRERRGMAGGKTAT
jgi:hypothetical protein